MTLIHPVILCGGSGTRLWPASRSSCPKQFRRAGNTTDSSFFQLAMARHAAPGFAPPTVVASAAHRALVAAQIAEAGLAAQVILEPVGRNTGPAVLAAALVLAARDPAALMLVVPADHMVEGDLNSPIRAMAPAASAGLIVSFGIRPRHAETGFGYITDAGPWPGFPGLHRVGRFIEKPPIRKARLLVESDVAYWASGLSLFAAATIIDEYERCDPVTLGAVRRALAGTRAAPDGLEPEAAAFAEAAAEPTEKAVFERSPRIALAPLDVAWNDVGSWAAMKDIARPDAQGNVLEGDVIAIDTADSLVQASSRLVSVVGMRDVIVIDTPDALLVTRSGHCQSVKKVAEYLKASRRREADAHVLAAPASVSPAADEAMPWGQRRMLVGTPGMTLFAATIAPGQTMMLEPDGNRMVMAVRGTARLSTLAGSLILTEGQRAEPDSEMPVMVSNPGRTAIEVVVARMAGAAVQMPVSAAAPWPVALHA